MLLDDLDALTFTPLLKDGRETNWLVASNGRLVPRIRGGADDDPPKDPPADPPKPDDDPPKDPPADPPAKVTFTPEQQAHIDSLIQKNTGKSKAAAEKEFKAWLDQQAMSEGDRLKAEKATIEAERDEARKEALAARVETTAERLALAAGCKPDRVSKLLRLVDLTSDDLAADGKPDVDAIKALVEKELTDTPELKGTGATGGASGSDDMGGAAGGKVWTREEVAKLSVEEFEKHEAEIMKQLQSTGVK